MAHRYGWIVLGPVIAIFAGYLIVRGNAPSDLPATVPKDRNSTKSVGAAKVRVPPADSPPSIVRPATEKRSLPPPNTPLKQLFAELKELADAGDAAAASQLYRMLAKCSRAPRAEMTYSTNVDNLLKMGSINPAALKDVPRVVEKLNALKTVCDNLDESVLGQLAPVTLQAAELGDASARNCYVHRGPSMDPRSLLENPLLLVTYKQAAPVLIDSALAAGDWRMVDMLQYAYGPNGQGLLAGLLGPDLVQHYRYLKLFLLGATDAKKEVYSAQMLHAEASLSSEQIAAADAWAQTKFVQNFSGVSTVAAPANWDACAIPED